MLPHGMGPDTVVERIAPWCVFQEMSTEDAEVTDLFRDTPVRYLGKV